MKSTWFSKPEHHEFAKCLEDVRRGSSSLWHVFSDWLTLAYLSISQAPHKLQSPTREICPKKEAEYMALIGKYKGDRYQRFPEALAILVNALKKNRYDFIGDVAGELGLLNQWNGQFFTPKTVCDMMVRMTMGPDVKPDREDRLTICEPCCGAGAMAIATASYLQELGFMPWHYWMVCQDVDIKMFMACYIQMTLRGVPCEMRWGNSLGGAEPKREFTIVGAMYPHRHAHLLGAHWLEREHCAAAGDATTTDTPSTKVKAPAASQSSRSKVTDLRRAIPDVAGQIHFNFDAA